MNSVVRAFAIVVFAAICIIFAVYAAVSVLEWQQSQISQMLPVEKIWFVSASLLIAGFVPLVFAAYFLMWGKTTGEIVFGLVGLIVLIPLHVVAAGYGIHEAWDRFLIYQGLEALLVFGAIVLWRVRFGS